RDLPPFPTRRSSDLERSRVGLLITSRAASWWTIWILLKGICFSTNEDGDPWVAVSGYRLRSTIRQGDVQFEDRATALVFERNLRSEEHTSELQSREN